jgi:hypothetical protein
VTGALSAVELLTDSLDACLTASKQPYFGWQLPEEAGSQPSERYGHAGLTVRSAPAWTIGAGDIPASEPLASAAPADLPGHARHGQWRLALRG